MKKLRLIVSSKTKKVYGFTVPNEAVLFYEGCFFNVQIDREKGQIIFTSGSSDIPTKKQIENYSFEDCKI